LDTNCNYYYYYYYYYYFRIGLNIRSFSDIDAHGVPFPYKIQCWLEHGEALAKEKLKERPLRPLAAVVALIDGANKQQQQQTNSNQQQQMNLNTKSNNAMLIGLGGSSNNTDAGAKTGILSSKPYLGPGGFQRCCALEEKKVNLDQIELDLPRYACQ
jgi:hypothetical protein